MGRISIVIPTHDRAGYLPESVRSIRAQRISDIEIIIVDDASGDPPRQRYGEDPLFAGVTWLCHDQNRGPGYSRRTGIQAAQGRYVGFLDDDDVLEPEYVETALTVLESNPAVGLFCCDATLIDAQGATLEEGRTFNSINAAIKRQHLTTGPRSLEEIFAMPTLGMGFLARRTVFDRVSYPATRRLEDYEFQLAVAASGFTVYYCHRPLARYRMHAGNASRAYGMAAMTEQLLASLRGAIERYPALRESSAVVRRRVADVQVDLGIARLREGQIRRGLSALASGIRADPGQARDVASMAWRWAGRWMSHREAPASMVARVPR